MIMSPTLDFMVFHPKEKGGAKRHPSLLDLVILRGNSAILIIKIGFLKARCRLAFKKPILVFPVPKALETPKSVS
ncbi:hypothetical protein B9G53_23815 [Pseudanabaena sp. SR411]|uniref:hypothetical protein n=1 Tax=Pseudanabaena sp. SR411 TaxID=1980935 RepID=UPI000BC9F883|nr:hypothetical protein [Pseudanabaena sp. SR411]OYQ62077.1 hypothetical protein B9G53_23815 [Pseudanabaena sp. SR411]